MEINSNSCSSFSSSSGSQTKMSTNRFLQPHRSIRKKLSIGKKVMKHHIAPELKIPPKIYKVEPKDFKKVVQKLTGPQPQPHGDRSIRRLKDLAPPPLDLAPPPQGEIIFVSDGEDTEIMGQVEKYNEKMDDYFKSLEALIMKSPKLLTSSCGSTSFGGLLSPFTPAFTLSPASLAWCSLFLSPGTVSTLDQSILLGR